MATGGCGFFCCPKSASKLIKLSLAVFSVELPASAKAVN